MTEKNTDPTTFGRVMRTAYEGDRIYFSRNGEELGHITLDRVPHDSKIRLSLAFDRSIRIDRREEQ